MKKSPIKKRNVARQKRRKKSGVRGEYHEWMSGFVCLLRDHPLFGFECSGDVVGHHIKHTNAGGKDYANEVALCWRHHDEIHRHGKAVFAELYCVDFDKEARVYAKMWKAKEPQK